MNNKKLFKGALVLFASILMAVSCSNNPANPEEPSKPQEPSEPQVTTITDAKITEALKAAFGTEDVTLGGTSKANFGSGKYEKGTYSIAGSNGDNSGNKPKLSSFKTLVTETKKSEIIKELEKIGVIVTETNIGAFEPAKKDEASNKDTAVGSFNITIKENYKLENTTTKITISVKVAGTTVEWAS